MKIECRKHWSIFITRGFWTFLFLVFAIVYLSMQEMAAFWGCLAAAIVIIAPAIILYKTEYIAIDGNMLVGHKGFIRSVRLSSPLSKVQGASLGNGLFGKIFRYHTVTLATAATGSVEYKFKQMANAKAFVDAVNERIA